MSALSLRADTDGRDSLDGYRLPSTTDSASGVARCRMLLAPPGLRGRRAQHGCHAQIARRANMSQESALAPSGKSRALFRASRRLEEGRFAIVTNVGSGMRWTQWCRSVRVAPTNDAKAYGEVVWSWRPDAGAKLCGMIHKATGARKPGPRGERDISC